MSLLDIAFLKDVSAFWIALACMVPALLFMVYVCFDDARQAKAAHHHEPTKAGPPTH